MNRGRERRARRLKDTHTHARWLSRQDQGRWAQGWRLWPGSVSCQGTLLMTSPFPDPATSATWHSPRSFTQGRFPRPTPTPALPRRQWMDTEVWRSGCGLRQTKATRRAETNTPFERVISLECRAPQGRAGCRDDSLCTLLLMAKPRPFAWAPAPRIGGRDSRLHTPIWAFGRGFKGLATALALLHPPCQAQERSPTVLAALALTHSREGSPLGGRNQLCTQRIPGSAPG